MELALDRISATWSPLRLCDDLDRLIDFAGVASGGLSELEGTCSFETMTKLRFDLDRLSRLDDELEATAVRSAEDADEEMGSEALMLFCSEEEVLAKK